MDTKPIAIVTGGAGFIGYHLVRELLARGYAVRVVDSLVASKRERVPAEAEFFEVDVRDAKKLGPIFQGARAVFHLAALPRVQDSIDRPVETHEVNVTGTVNVLVAAKASGNPKVVLASSAAVYGNLEAPVLHEGLEPSPVSPYGLHKYVGERYLALFSAVYGLPTVSLRFFNVYGPGLDPEGPYALVVGRFLKLRKEGKPLTITGDGKQTRDFVHVSDIVRALIAAAESESVGKGEVMNAGTGRGASVNELATFFGGEHTYVPARLEPKNSCADIAKAKELLKWEPVVPLEKGIEELKKENGL